MFEEKEEDAARRSGCLLPLKKEGKKYTSKVDPPAERRSFEGWPKGETMHEENYQPPYMCRFCARHRAGILVTEKNVGKQQRQPLCNGLALDSDVSRGKCGILLGIYSTDNKGEVLEVADKLLTYIEHAGGDSPRTTAVQSA